MRDADAISVDLECQPLHALLAIALQLKAKLDAKDGVKRNLGSEAVLLRSFGFKNPEIAKIIGSTSGSVAELVSQAQKGSKNGKPKNKRIAGKADSRSAKKSGM